MKLSYRGIDYHQNPVVVSSNQFKAFGKYRGATVELHKSSSIALNQHRNPLTYRGAIYS
ncbi:MAG TPA: DUF4278 domain-containing protein [Xenococcaceae cyanobacterium]